MGLVFIAADPLRLQTDRRSHGAFYFGSRTCRADPLADRYTGSGVWQYRQNHLHTALHKSILGIFPSVSTACLGERSLISENSASALCVNAKRDRTLNDSQQRAAASELSPAEIKSARESLGLSHSDFAAARGFRDRVTILPYRGENGDRIPSPQTITLIRQLLEKP